MSVHMFPPSARRAHVMGSLRHSHSRNLQICHRATGSCICASAVYIVFTRGNYVPHYLWFVLFLSTSSLSGCRSDPHGLRVPSITGKKRKTAEEACPSPELHPAVDQGQRDEVLLALLAVVEQDAGHLRRPELHGDAHGVVGAHGLESQVGLAPERRDEVLDGCGGMETNRPILSLAHSLLRYGVMAA